MIIYLVTVNGKVSQEAYKTLEEARDFIQTRTSFSAWDNDTMMTAGEFKIYDVRVK